MSVSRYRMSRFGKRLTGCPSKAKMAKKWKRAMSKCFKRHGVPRRGARATVRGRSKFSKCLRREYSKGIPERCRE